jgi:hypothetical protein
LIQPWNPYWWGRFSTVDLLELTSFDQFILILKILFNFFTKRVTLMRGSTILSLPLLSVFTGSANLISVIILCSESMRGLWIKDRGFYSMLKELKRVLWIHLNFPKKTLNNLKCSNTSLFLWKKLFILIFILLKINYILLFLSEKMLLSFETKFELIYMEIYAHIVVA